MFFISRGVDPGTAQAFMEPPQIDETQLSGL
jgi:hypothetical protein